MSKKYIGAVVPNQDLVAVFYEEGKLIREEIISLVVSECWDQEVGREIIITEPLSLGDFGVIVNAEEMVSYLGIEKKNKPLDWSKGIKKLEEQKKKAQEDEELSKLSEKELADLIKKEEKKQEGTQKKKS